MIVLGIESSCDETGVALYDEHKGLLAHKIYSQVTMHADYGGVVPELASRDHVRKTIPLIDQLLKDTHLERKDIDAIAYTRGPGLLGALMVGAAIANSLALALDVPVIGIHHMEGHLLAPMLEESPPAFPFVALLVSGGHTQLVAVEAIGDYKILGESLDDAAGEAFDKAAKMLGEDYPGGPKIARLAQLARDKYAGTPHRFPRPMVDRPGLDFSFSGLKTYTLNTIADAGGLEQLTEKDAAQIALAFEEAVVDTLRIKCQRALKETGMKTLVIAGGVSANRHLREVLEPALAKMGVTLSYSRPEFCTDNGAMIAYAGIQRLKAGQQDTDLSFDVKARWPIDTLLPIT